MSIKFNRDCIVQDFRQGTPDEESYKAGQVVHDLPEASEAHWVSRGKADYCKGDAASSKPKAAAKPKAAPKKNNKKKPPAKKPAEPAPAKLPGVMTSKG